MGGEFTEVGEEGEAVRGGRRGRADERDRGRAEEREEDRLKGVQDGFRLGVEEDLERFERKVGNELVVVRKRRREAGGGEVGQGTKVFRGGGRERGQGGGVREIDGEMVHLGEGEVGLDARGGGGRELKATRNKNEKKEFSTRGEDGKKRVGGKREERVELTVDSQKSSPSCWRFLRLMLW